MRWAHSFGWQTSLCFAWSLNGSAYSAPWPLWSSLDLWHFCGLCQFVWWGLHPLQRACPRTVLRINSSVLYLLLRHSMRSCFLLSLFMWFSSHQRVQRRSCMQQSLLQSEASHILRPRPLFWRILDRWVFCSREYLGQLSLSDLDHHWDEMPHQSFWIVNSPKSHLCLLSCSISKKKRSSNFALGTSSRWFLKHPKS